VRPAGPAVAVFVASTALCLRVAAIAGPAGLTFSDPHRPSALKHRTALLVDGARRLLDADAGPKFRSLIASNYEEEELARLLDDGDVELRTAALMGLHVVGTMSSNESVGRALHDLDPNIRALAARVCWSVWHRGGAAAENQRLRDILRHADFDDYGKTMRTVEQLDGLVRDAPRFAEARNQRAVAHAMLGNWALAIEDCNVVLRMNPVHFGAQQGLAVCHQALHHAEAAEAAMGDARRIRPDVSPLSFRMESALEKLSD
ncbi:MAG: hypothetical protein ACRDD1_06110, partial [Planctomycetia bacterium]